MIERAAQDAGGIFTRPPRYVPSSPWSPLSALAVTALACLVSIAAFFAGVVIAVALGIPGTDIGAFTESMASLATPWGILTAIASQVLSLAVIWIAAGRAGMRREVLRLEVRPGLWTCLGAGALIVALTGLVDLAFYAVAGFDPLADTKWLVEGLRSQYWWATVIMAVVLAPLWEELAFRGFLLSALAKSEFGFWPAALVSNVLWTLLHVSYSVSGLVNVFVAGLVLSWLMSRTGSIWVVIAAHAITNVASILFTSMMAPPL